MSDLQGGTDLNPGRDIFIFLSNEKLEGLFLCGGL